MEINGNRTVLTPEQVAITYTVAGIGTRFIAILLDTLIQGTVGFVLIFSLSLLSPVFDLDIDILDTASGWMIALLVLLLFGVLWGYFIFWESIWNGQTPGKKISGIRVLRDSGHPVDFRAVFIRNISRYVDFLPFCYGIGGLAMFLSKDSKRLGDFAAGTVVVIDSQPAPVLMPTRQSSLVYKLLGDPSLLNLRALTREQFLVVERFLERRYDLSGDVAGPLARQIALPLMPLIGVPIPTGDAYPYDVFLEELAAAYRARNV